MIELSLLNFVKKNQILILLKININIFFNIIIL